jgi:hypothetical protein
MRKRVAATTLLFISAVLAAVADEAVASAPSESERNNNNNKEYEYEYDTYWVGTGIYDM